MQIYGPLNQTMIIMGYPSGRSRQTTKIVQGINDRKSTTHYTIYIIILKKCIIIIIYILYIYTWKLMRHVHLLLHTKISLKVDKDSHAARFSKIHGTHGSF